MSGAASFDGTASVEGTAYARTVTLRNAEGLHARPAAEFVKLATRFAERVTVNGRDARSLLAILSLGLTQGASLEIACDEASGRDAVEALASLVDSAFARRDAEAE